MHLKEYAAKKRPELVDPECVGGMHGCPSDYGFMADLEWCNCDETSCTRCWNREILEEKENEKMENMNDELKRLYKIEERVEVVKDFVRTQDFVSADHILTILGIEVDKKGENA